MNSVRKSLTKKFVNLLLCLNAIAFHAAGAQEPTRMPRVGFLVPGSPETFKTRIEAFRQGLRDIGYVEGQNILVEYHYVEGKQELFDEKAIELVRLKFDAIVTSPTSSVRAVKKATKTIPIVFTNVGDPVGTGLVASLSRPGGNATGLSSVLSDLGGKRLELLTEAFPKVKRVGMFRNPDAGDIAFKATDAVAGKLGVQLKAIDVRNANDFDAGFEVMAKFQPQALMPAPTPIVNAQRTRIIQFAAKHRIPGMYAIPEFTEPKAGGLMSYAPSYTDLYRRAAIYVDKILKGAKPADLPVEQPTKFEFIINLKTAKQIGLTIPPNVLARADGVIK